LASEYDVIVVGIGAMGSAAVFHLAQRGLKVLGLERFNIPNDMGSSHGITRIIRLAYYEHPSYVPLLLRAYELWRELEQVTGEKLLCITGSIDAGPPDGEIFEGARLSCQLHSLPHEILSASQLRRKFPAYHLPPSTMAVLQPDGGFLLPEQCISSHVIAALSRGAEVHAREPLLGWEPRGKGVRVRTETATYDAARLVLVAGAWMPELAPILRRIAVPERQVLAWFQPRGPELFRPASFPVFNLTVDEGRYYGFPVFQIPGFKVGRYHHRNEIVDPETMDRECHPQDESVLREFVAKYFPDGAGPTMSLHTCIFTNTPDEHFILDRHPEWPQVLLGSPCSGHGFKFASVVGEILADLVQHDETRHDISLHRLERVMR
jgi:sarcosine oxidase